MQKFPTRTLVLMALALLAFVWFWLQTHRAPKPARAAEPPAAVDVQVLPGPLGADR